ncbi:right-handed parallel beta-helix repeat-containing protein, partial [Pedobacter lithocola]
SILHKANLLILSVFIKCLFQKNNIDPIGATYTWYCQSDEQSTTIWANFQQANPNTELIEISARRTVFYPDKPGINFITISGFTISQAATQWAAPTAEQIGMIATNWNKGWIIENNIISDSKCNGITLGKDRTTGHNVWGADQGNVNRDGNIHYIEVVFNALRNNWTKETIGSHIVRNNQIFNCEQTGICGSMGAAFSIIENNHIYNIWQKRQFEGWEIGGIKFHAPIDATIRKNNIHNCGRGMWLDWMTQGTRVSSNLFYNNDQQDLYIEVNHGPFVIDNNIFLSPVAIQNQSEGGAYLHNLIAGEVLVRNDLNRFTPYFLPHSVAMKGLTTIFGGDDRVYNNIIIGGSNPEAKYGIEGYNNAKLPVWIKGNIYYKQAKPSNKDENFATSTANPEIKVIVEGGDTFLHFTTDKAYFEQKVQLITTELLGKAKIPKAAFENPDGTALIMDTDYFGNKRSDGNIHAGPFVNLKSGKVFVKVWMAKKAI